MCLAQGSRTRGPSVLSQALYHRATALPYREVVNLRIYMYNPQFFFFANKGMSCVHKRKVSHRYFFYTHKICDSRYYFSALDKLLCHLGIYATWLSSISHLQKQLRIFIFFTPHFFLWLHVFLLHEAIGNVLAYLFIPIICLPKVLN